MIERVNIATKIKPDKNNLDEMATISKRGHQILNCELERKSNLVMPSLGSSGSQQEQKRLDTIATFCAVVAHYKLRLSTLEMAYYIWGSNLNNYINGNLRLGYNSKLTLGTFAISATSALRMAIKFEERVEVICNLPQSAWKLMSCFQDWPIEKNDRDLLAIECLNLTANECLTTPLPNAVFDHLLHVGGWPQPFASIVQNLGHYILALSLFGCGKNHVREHIKATKLAAVAVALAVMIINNINTNCTSKLDDKTATYEYFPKRLEVYTGYYFEKDLKSTAFELLQMLRSVPSQAHVLKKIFPNWANHNWH